jgi:hypothetical protein
MKKPRKRLVFPFVFSNDRLEAKFDTLLKDTDPRLRHYVYRAAHGRRIGKAIYIGLPIPGRQLLDYLRDEKGGGDFHVMIRRARTMEFSGILRIGVPLRADPRSY